MPVMDGHELLRQVRSSHPEVPVIMMTAVNKDIADAVQAIKEGAFDYIQKGFFNNEEFLRRVVNAVERKRLREENLRLKNRLAGGAGGSIIVGRSERVQAILSVVDRVAPTGSTVLITGESGVGKELVAQALHRNSGRKGAFLTVNCGAFPDELLESELFGHARGSFTGAVADKRGLFEEADGGTLFLDEVGEMSTAMQVKLLRVLQEGTFRPVGTTEERSASVRIVTATNRDLESMVQEGEFREDLYYRINVIPIHVPPLRERAEDIQAMVAHFVSEFSADMGKDIRQVTAEALEALERYAWPGNVRELRNVIERSLALATSDVLDREILPERVREGRAADAAGGQWGGDRTGSPRGLAPRRLPRRHPAPLHPARTRGLRRQSDSGRRASPSDLPLLALLRPEVRPPSGRAGRGRGLNRWKDLFRRALTPPCSRASIVSPPALRGPSSVCVPCWPRSAARVLEAGSTFWCADAGRTWRTRSLLGPSGCAAHEPLAPSAAETTMPSRLRAPGRCRLPPREPVLARLSPGRGRAIRRTSSSPAPVGAVAS